MIRGRKPKPTHLKVIEGNPGKRQLNLEEPIPSGELREPPEWMSDAQREIWTTALANAPPGLLKRLDESVFQVWVVAKALHQEAARYVNKWGPVIKVGDNNTPVQSPYLPIINKQSQIMMKAAAELGFSPSSRSRVKIKDPSQRSANRFAELKRIDEDDD